jgi:YVTN family beta-propeller protein
VFLLVASDFGPAVGATVPLGGSSHVDLLASELPRIHPAPPLTYSSITLSPSSGEVGSTIAANATGFAGDTNVSFNFAGVPVPSNCSADASGKFPGSTGTPCTFRVPTTSPGTGLLQAYPSPRAINVGDGPDAALDVPSIGQIFIGNEQDCYGYWCNSTVSVINESTGAVVASDLVGQSPVAFAVDPTSGQVFVANEFDCYGTGCNGSVTIISESNDSVVTTVQVGSEPDALTDDAATQQVFVANYGSNSVSVISAINDSLTTTIPVFRAPEAIVDDPGTGHVFVANRRSNSVSVLDVANDTYAATVAVGSRPDAALDDPSVGQIFVSNYFDNNVSILSATNGSTIATVNVGDYPIGLTLDPYTGQVFVVNTGSNNVSVISVASDSLVGTITVGSQPQAVGVDASSGQALVANAASNNVTVVSTASDTIIANVAVGGYPYAVAGGTATATMFVADYGSDQVSEVSIDALANATFDVLPFTPHLAISPSSGALGSSIAANGTGFGSDLNISLDLAGVPVASTCRTDGNGTFPGTSGTPCTFSVPSVLSGATDVVATADWGAGGAQVGAGPDAMVFDPGTGQTFVANGGDCLGTGCNGTVSVLNDSTEAVVATIEVGPGPQGMVYDPAVGQVFVSNYYGCIGRYCDSTVSIINTTTDTVVATLVVGSGALSFLYDPQVGEVFVVNEDDCLGPNCDGTIGVIDPANDSLVTTIQVGSGPDAIAEDAADGELFVANSQSDNVSIISTANDSVVGSIGVGRYPSALAFDAGTDQLFVANEYTSNLSIISAATNNVTKTIQVSSYPGLLLDDPTTGQIFLANFDYLGTVTVLSPWSDDVLTVIPVGANPDAFAYSSVTDQLTVANGQSDNVSVISSSSDTVIATIPVGTSPDAASYDTSGGEVFVANSRSSNVSLVALSAPVVPFTVTTGAGRALTLSASSGTVGSTVSVNGTGFAPDHELTFTLNGTSLPSTCTTDANGNFPGAIHRSCLLTIPPAPGGPTTIVVSDGTHQANASYRVEARLVLHPVSGPAGSGVAATGTGFASDTTVSFTFAGAAVTSTCRTDATGSFPGTSGTACTFVVPASIPGPEPVLATAGATSQSAEFSVTELTLTPLSGTVGNLIAATGEGFPVSSSIVFTVGGAPTTSDCRTDSSGDFPGTTGTPCQFILPDVPGGLENVTAGTPPTLFDTPAVNVGSDPYSVVFDPLTNQAFVGNYYSANVSVVSGATDTLVATVPVGQNPEDLADDPATGQVFVVNQGSNNVSVISAFNDSVVATIPVGYDSQWVYFDAASAQVYVLDDQTDNVTIISATNDTVVATIAVGSSPESAVSDPATGQVFIANFGSDNVSVISTATDSVVGSIPLTAGPYAIADDPSTSQVFVTQPYGDNVSIISASDDSVVTTLAVGGYPASLVYDPASAQVFVANQGTNNVSILSAVTDTLVATDEVGLGPWSLTDNAPFGQVVVADSYSNNASVIAVSNDSVVSTVPTGDYSLRLVADPLNGNVFLANFGSDNVSILVPPSEELASDADGYTVFTVNASLGLLLPTGRISVDVGQTLEIEGAGFGPSVAIGTFTLGASSLACASASVGSCDRGTVSTAADGSFDATFVVPAVPSAGNYTVTATDPDGNHAVILVAVEPDPVVGSVTATPPSIDVGQTVTFSIGGATLGSGDYVYRWAGLPTNCTTAGMNATCTPSTTGNYSVSVSVTDSNGFTASSVALGFAVHPNPTVGTPSATPGSGHVDAGQSVTFHAVGRLGSGTYSSYTWFDLPGTGCAGSTSASVTCSGADLPEGNYSISVEVTDSSGVTSPVSGILSFQVEPDPTVATPTANRTSLDVGQTVVFSESTTGVGDSYVWGGMPAGCPTESYDEIVCRVTTAGVYNATVTLTDANAYSVQSAPVEVDVLAALTVNVTAAPAGLDLGQSLVLTATIAGGSGGETFTWSGLPAGCAGAGATISCTPTATARSLVQVQVTDSNGETAQSLNVGVTVAPVVTATVSASATTTTVGQSVDLTASGSGGTGALTYAWVFGDGTKGTGDSVSHTYTTMGVFTAMVWVNDSVGGSTVKSVTITVGAASSSGSSASGLSLADEAGIAIAVIVVAVLLGVLLLRGRTRSPPTSTTASAPTTKADPSEHSAPSEKEIDEPEE